MATTTKSPAAAAQPGALFSSSARSAVFGAVGDLSRNESPRNRATSARTDRRTEARGPRGPQTGEPNRDDPTVPRDQWYIETQARGFGEQTVATPERSRFAVTGASVEGFTQPEHGVVRRSRRNPNRLIYVPTAGYSGIDSFHYLLVDREGREAWATVVIEVRSLLSPGASGDAGPAMQIHGFTQPACGMVKRDGEDPNRLVYKPLRNYTGADAFQYGVGNGHTGGRWAVVAVNIYELS